jgi:hypothetical protein
LLKQRHGGQAMFALCSGTVLAGWLLCVLAEQATAHLGKAAEHSSSDSTTSSSSGCGTAGKEQQGEPVGSTWWLHVLLQNVQNRIMPAGFGADGSDAAAAGLSSPASGRARSRQQKYAELASKDSGPDLQRHLEGCVVNHQHATAAF